MEKLYDQGVEMQSLTVGDRMEMVEGGGVKSLDVDPNFAEADPPRTADRPGSQSSRCCRYCAIVVCLAGIAIGAATALTKGWELEGDSPTDMVVGTAESSVSSNSYGASKGDSEPVSSQAAGEEFEDSIKSTFDQVWFDLDSGGWNGGSHDDGIRFCEQFNGSHGKRMELCPYAAYCPEGPTFPVVGGHLADFDGEGEQWAPVYGVSNQWVMIGKLGHNSATTCLSHVQLTGKEPPWGLDGSNKEVKQHIMCCSPFQ